MIKYLEIFSFKLTNFGHIFKYSEIPFKWNPQVEYTLSRSKYLNDSTFSVKFTIFPIKVKYYCDPSNLYLTTK